MGYTYGMMLYESALVDENLGAICTIQAQALSDALLNTPIRNPAKPPLLQPPWMAVPRATRVMRPSMDEWRSRLVVWMEKSLCPECIRRGPEDSGMASRTGRTFGGPDEPITPWVWILSFLFSGPVGRIRHLVFPLGMEQMEWCSDTEEKTPLVEVRLLRAQKSLNITELCGAKRRGKMQVSGLERSQTDSTLSQSSVVGARAVCRPSSI